MKSATLAKIKEIVAALFILLFVYTATSKLLSHDSFVTTLRKSPLIGFANSFLSWTIPLVELLISILLLIPKYRTRGLSAVFILMTVFTFYIAYMLLSSSHLPCSCGGVISKLSWKEHLWLNIFLTVLAAVPLYLQQQKFFIRINRISRKPV